VCRHPNAVQKTSYQRPVLGFRRATSQRQFRWHRPRAKFGAMTTELGLDNLGRTDLQRWLKQTLPARKPPMLSSEETSSADMTPPSRSLVEECEDVTSLTGSPGT
jgi:hypothetical protein